MEAAPSVRPAAPVVFEDGIGERLSAVGGANEALEVLKVSTELSVVSTFESALREQSLRLSEFHHEAFARVRSVERLDARTSTVAVISDRVRGVRLSDVLATAERQQIPLELNAALCLIRQLVNAMAVLHEAAPDSCHGAIAPERLMVTPDGRLVIVEYVMGPALEELRFSQERYWRELGIALPHTFGLPRFDLFADVTQIGAVSLALLLGRRLTADEYPARIGEVVDQAATTLESGQQEPIPVLLRAWLRSALQLETRHSFVSAIGAKKELEVALSHASLEAERASLKVFLTKYANAVMADRRQDAPAAVAPPVAAPVVAAPVVVPPVVAGPVAPAPVAPSMMAVVPAPPVPSPVAPPVAKAPAVAAPIVVPVPVAPAAASPVVTPAVVAVPAAARTETSVPPKSATPASVATSVSAPATAAPTSRPAVVAPVAAATPEPADHGDEEIDMPSAAARTSRPVWMSPWAGAAVAAVAIVATLGFTLMRPSTPSKTEVANGTLTVGTSPDGVAVFIDGVSRGTTPLNLNLPAGNHVLELVTDGERRRIPMTITAGAQVSQYLELGRAAAGATGNLQVRTDPPRALVTVDGQAYGRTPTVVNGLTPGPHQVVLQLDNDRVSEQVLIEAGTTASLVVPLGGRPAPGSLSGWIAVSAPAEVQIYEGQRLLGTSRMDRIMVPVGRHELEFVNESLGFRATRSVDVGNGQVAAVKPEWPKGSVALNALPWAEVFVDGERLGETPIGSASLPIGVHEVVFRHPELGERKASAIVTLGAPARLSVDMRAK